MGVIDEKQVEILLHETIYNNLMQNDMVALRAVMRLGWEIPNPINAFNVDLENAFPFAVYEPASGG